MLGKMGCGSIKSTVTNKSDNLIEDIDTNIGAINLMEISDDRSMIVIAGETGVALVLSTFSTPTEIIGKLVGHEAGITCSTIDNLYIYTGSVDQTVRKWSIETMDCLFIFIGHSSKINRIMIKSNFLFTTSYDKTAKVWISNVVITPYDDFDDDQDEDSIDLVNDNKPKLCNVDRLTKEQLTRLSPCFQTYKGHTKSVYPIIFLPTDSDFDYTGRILETDLVVTGSVDCTIRIWSFKYGDCLKLLTDHYAPIFSLLVDPLNSKQFISASGDGKLISWDAVTGESVKVMKDHSGPVISCTTYNRMLFSGSNDRTVRAWVIEFGECVRVFHGNSCGVSLVQYYNGLVCVGLGDGIANIFDSKSGTLRKSLHGHQESITGLQVAANRIFTCDLLGKLCVWDISDIKEETVFGKRIEEDENSDDDCEAVRRAIDVVDKYVRN
ncbi:WD repeat-containing protein 86-like [Panonychus citri]|uniref:WD repeat-containing protein 86-like n=1 Tax=Panonychus citri TaxID=50023 RepID=UPI00230759BD|nr:WD repeat-containing protein 86-like [Panonychus citri]